MLVNVFCEPSIIGQDSPFPKFKQPVYFLNLSFVCVLLVVGDYDDDVDDDDDNDDDL